MYVYPDICLNIHPHSTCAHTLVPGSSGSPPLSSLTPRPLLIDEPVILVAFIFSPIIKAFPFRCVCVCACVMLCMESSLVKCTTELRSLTALGEALA